MGAVDAFVVGINDDQIKNQLTETLDDAVALCMPVWLRASLPDCLPARVRACVCWHF